MKVSIVCALWLGGWMGLLVKARTPPREGTSSPWPRRVAAAAPAVTSRTSQWDPSAKEHKICSVLGGLDLTRLRSFHTQAIFRSTIEDVELLRETYAESMYNGGLAGGFSDLEKLAQTLDWQTRGLAFNDTTLTVGLGYVDDRPDRRIDRHYTTLNIPLVGDSQADMDWLDTASNLLPWMLDRRSNEALWYRSHSIGRSEGAAKEALSFDALYIATWCVSWGGGLVYYPPLNVFHHPYTIGDSLGGDYNYRYIPATPPGWPFAHEPGYTGGSLRDAMFGAPYADVAKPGLSMISAVAPVYYTGNWQGFDYQDTFLGTVGVDITLDAIADALSDLEETLAQGSFALLVDANTFDVIALSQQVLEIIYPERTGFEEERVTRLAADGSIVEDRRNQTYVVSDTIWQSLLDDLESANWQDLYTAVQATPRGERSHVEFNITATGTTEPRTYYAMWDRWDAVSEWAVLVFAPVDGVNGAIVPQLDTTECILNARQGETLQHHAMLSNDGVLDIVVYALAVQTNAHIRLLDKDQWVKGVRLAAGKRIPVEFLVETADMGLGTTTTQLILSIVDDGYPDCIYDSTRTIQVSVRVSPEPDLNHLRKIRLGGLALYGIVLTTGLGFMIWMYRFRETPVVRASQPLFLVMICVGCLVMGSGILPLSVDDGLASQRGCDMACMAAPWLFSMGFVTAFAALFSKIWRVNQIFRKGSFQKITVTERGVMVPFAILFSLNFVVLLAWTLHDSLVWTRKPQGEWDSYGMCSSHGKASFVYLALLGLIDLSALVLAVYQAYQAREIGDEFSETKYIGACIVTMLQISAIGLPLLFLVRENPTPLFFVKSGILFVVCMSILLLIFVPKIIHVKNYRKLQIRREAATLERIMKNASGQESRPESDGGSSTQLPEPSHSRGVEGANSTAASPGIRIITFDQGAPHRQLQESHARIQALERQLRENGIHVAAREEAPASSLSHRHIRRTSVAAADPRAASVSPESRCRDSANLDSLEEGL